MKEIAVGFVTFEPVLLGLIRNCLSISELVKLSKPITLKHSFISKIYYIPRNPSLPLIYMRNLHQ